MANKVEWIVVGKFGRPQGLKGLSKVISFTEPKENITNYSPWYTNISGDTKPIKIADFEKSNKFILAKVDGYEDRDKAASLTNVEILIHNSQLANLSDGEYYWHQLVGMEVINNSNIKLGVVDDILATGSNDVLVVSGEKRFLIPYIIEEYVLDINSEKNLITVNWDEGF